MEIATVQWRPTPLHFAPFSASYGNCRPTISRRKRFVISASSSSSSEPDGFSWLRLAQSIRRGSQRFFENVGESVKKETGFNLKVPVDEFQGRARDSARKAQEKLERVNSELLPQFISWNKWESWKVCFLVLQLWRWFWVMFSIAVPVFIGYLHMFQFSHDRVFSGHKELGFKKIGCFTVIYSCVGRFLSKYI